MSLSLYQIVILIVSSNPKPSDGIRFKQSQGSVSQTYADRIDWLVFFHALEEKSRVRGIITP